MQDTQRGLILGTWIENLGEQRSTRELNPAVCVYRARIFESLADVRISGIADNAVGQGMILQRLSMAFKSVVAGKKVLLKPGWSIDSASLLIECAEFPLADYLRWDITPLLERAK